MAEVRVTEVIIKTEPQVILTLSKEEARVLCLILGKVGGDPSGPRGQVDDIYIALVNGMEKAKIDRAEYIMTAGMGKLGGCYIHFVA